MLMSLDLYNRGRPDGMMLMLSQWRYGWGSSGRDRDRHRGSRLRLRDLDMGGVLVLGGWGVWGGSIDW